MEKLTICRICLIKDVRMHCLVNSSLQEIHELLTGKVLETKDPRPVHACYVCCARLRNCLQLRSACLHSEELFTRLLDNDNYVVASLQDMRMLQTIPVVHLNVDPETCRDSEACKDLEACNGIIDDNVPRADPLSLTDDVHMKEEYVEGPEGNVIDQGICSQLIKQDDVKSEIVSSDDELDNSFQITEEQTNSASDNSCLEDDTLQTNSSKCNHSIPSVNLLDNICDKTVKIVLHRVDLNSYQEGASVTKKLTPANQKKRSQSIDVTNTENEEIVKTNIWTENMKTLHIMSSEIHSSPKMDSFKDIRTRTGEKLYKCGTCGRGFTYKCRMLAHIRTHTGETPYKCDTCGKGFWWKCLLLRHIPVHTGVKPYNCDKCGRGYNSKSSLSHHLRLHTDETQLNCNRRGKGSCHEGIFKENFITHPGEKPYKCGTCGKGFWWKCLLLRHIPIHTGVKPYKCDTCGRGYNCKSSLSHHLRLHTDETQLNCNRRGKGSSHERIFKENFVTHTGEKPYKCHTCGKGFWWKCLLLRHIPIHTGVKPYKCDTCGRGYNCKSSLSHHLRLHTDETIKL